SSDLGPGATELGVSYYIDKQMAGAWGLNGTDYRQGPFPSTENMLSAYKIFHTRQNRGNVFIDGLKTLNQESNDRFEVAFNEASVEQQTEIMLDLQKVEKEVLYLYSDVFFFGLKQAVLEGHDSDPLYVGNKIMSV